MASDGRDAKIGALVKTQERERARIARGLHDGVGQRLTRLQIALDQIALTVPVDEHRAQLRELSAEIAETARELHEVIYELHPLRLELLGLAKSIKALCSEISRQSGITISVSCDAALPEELGANESLCLYRVAQEALNNVMKHSTAAHASVTLLCVRGALRLVVADSGRGFDKSAMTNGLGLTSMRQRVQLLKGTIVVETHRGGGTSISVRIPVRRLATIDGAVSKLRRVALAHALPRLAGPCETGNGSS
jgi:signal transduction histidine kinase